MRNSAVSKSLTRYRAALWLLVIGVSSLGLTTFSNRHAGVALLRMAPKLSWIADATIPSFLVSLVIYLAVRPVRRFGLPVPRTNWRWIVRASTYWLAVWLTASVVVPLTFGRFRAYTHGAARLAGFVMIAPLAEELLFRGAIFELCERAFARRRWTPVIVSTVFFSLHHLELHAFRLTEAALAQVAFTVPMGLLWGAFRREAQSIWPGFGLHVLTNLPGAFGP
jgi:membrane protease YdiL (CAAX protease family)